jgi:hypothetical protein
LSWSWIADALKSAGMDGIPQDPNITNVFSGLAWDPSADENTRVWQYGYIRVKRNGVSNKAFVVMAKTETPGASNRLHLADTFASWYIKNTEDSSSIIPCKKMTKVSSSSWALVPGGECFYSDLSQLRFIMVR